MALTTRIVCIRNRNELYVFFMRVPVQRLSQARGPVREFIKVDTSHGPRNLRDELGTGVKFAFDIDARALTVWSRLARGD